MLTENNPLGKSHGSQESTELGVRKRILIVEDHEVMRRGIRSLLDDQPDLEICGEAVDGLDALAKTDQLQPDLLILDVSMPRMGGFSAAHRIRKQNPAMKILIFTTYNHEQVETPWFGPLDVTDTFSSRRRVTIYYEEYARSSPATNSMTRRLSKSKRPSTCLLKVWGCDDEFFQRLSNFSAFSYQR